MLIEFELGDTWNEGHGVTENHIVDVHNFSHQEFYEGLKKVNQKLGFDILRIFDYDNYIPKEKFEKIGKFILCGEYLDGECSTDSYVYLSDSSCYINIIMNLIKTEYPNLQWNFPYSFKIENIGYALFSD